MRERLDEIREWLDTETKAVLCPDPPEKLVASATVSFSLLLVTKGKDEQRIADIVSAIQRSAPPKTLDYPFVVGQQMNLEEALAGQFALACCDCVAAFVRDDIVDESAIKAFRQIHSEVLSSPEFEQVAMRIEFIPNTEQGHRFCWQFFGLASGLQIPVTINMYRKKARLMEHWAKRIGASYSVSECASA
jgi:hypothetical protein